MLLIDNGNSHDPAFNLALEEYCLLNLPMQQRYLLLYVNAPAIVIGKHQNAFQEINTHLVQTHQLPVLRRISGGGTVFHDLGNLNFSFIQPYSSKEFNNYEHFTGAIARALAAWGVPALLTERGDITVEGKKVSGSAQAMRQGRLASHGTLLFRSDLALIAPILKPKPGLFTSKSRQSVRSPVTNIGNYLPDTATINAFSTRLAQALSPGAAPPQRFLLTSAQRNEVEALARTKYRTWEWNYGQSPKFTLQREATLSTGPATSHIEVAKGHLVQATIKGIPHSSPIAQALIGQRYHPTNLHTALQTVLAELSNPMPALEELVDLLY